jgi:uncharacterized protein YjbJ (UPF0337 family)
MTVGKKAKAGAQGVKGKMKESVGHAVGNKRLVAEGKKDQAAGAVKYETAKAKESVRQGARGAVGSVKEAAGKVTGNRSLRAKGKAEKTVAKVRRKINK